MSGTQLAEKCRTRKDPRPAILLRPGALKRLFEPEGITSYQAMSAALNYSVGMLHGAHKGEAVGARLILAVRNRWPHIPYEDVFTEGFAPHAAARDQAA